MWHAWGKKRNAYRVVAGKSEARDHVEDLGTGVLTKQDGRRLDSYGSGQRPTVALYFRYNNIRGIS